MTTKDPKVIKLIAKKWGRVYTWTADLVNVKEHIWMFKLSCKIFTNEILSNMSGFTQVVYH